MAAKSTAKPIDPETHYEIKFSKSFEYEGTKYVPRQGQTLTLKGDVVELVKEHLDSYEAI